MRLSKQPPARRRRASASAHRQRRHRGAKRPACPPHTAKELTPKWTRRVSHSGRRRIDAIYPAEYERTRFFSPTRSGEIEIDRRITGCCSNCRLASRRSAAHFPSHETLARHSRMSFSHPKSTQNSVRSPDDIDAEACCHALAAPHPPVETPGYSNERPLPLAANGCPFLRPRARRAEHPGGPAR